MLSLLEIVGTEDMKFAKMAINVLLIKETMNNRSMGKNEILAYGNQEHFKENTLCVFVLLI